MAPHLLAQLGLPGNQRGVEGGLAARVGRDVADTGTAVSDLNMIVFDNCFPTTGVRSEGRGAVAGVP